MKAYITAPGSVPNYTAWWQRHICVNNLPKVVTWKRESGTRTRDLRSHKSNVLITTPPDHSQCVCSPLCKRVLTLHVSWINSHIDARHRDTVSTDQLLSVRLGTAVWDQRHDQWTATNFRMSRQWHTGEAGYDPFTLGVAQSSVYRQ